MKLIKSSDSLGGQIEDIDLKVQLDEAQINFINQSWNERLVVVFKNQDLNDKALINFSKNFGNLTLQDLTRMG